MWCFRISLLLSGSGPGFLLEEGTPTPPPKFPPKWEKNKRNNWLAVPLNFVSRREPGSYSTFPIKKVHMCFETLIWNFESWEMNLWIQTSKLIIIWAPHINLKLSSKLSFHKTLICFVNLQYGIWKISKMWKWKSQGNLKLIFWNFSF